MFVKICKSTENYSFRLFYQINYRPTKTDKNSEELLTADRHVEKYKEVLDKICRKFVPNPTSNNTNVVNVDQDARDKRCKKVHEYKLAQSMEESLKDLPEGLLRDVLENCGKFSLAIYGDRYCKSIYHSFRIMIDLHFDWNTHNNKNNKKQHFFYSKIGEKYRHRNRKQWN